MEKNEVLDVIMKFARAIRETPKINKKTPYYYFDDSENRIWSANYLLNQILRQYYIDDNHILVSKKAQELWDKIAVETDIKSFYYRKKFTTKNDIAEKMFSGAKKEGVLTQKNKGQKVIWNDIFHDEHVIPIDTIIKRLVNEPELNYEKTKKILDDIVICKMLKEENNVLDKKGYRTKRKETVKQTIDDIYINECEIQIVGWEDKKNKL